LDKKCIGEKLQALRGKKSRQEVAEALRISISALQMYENGQRVPRDEVKIRIANYYGVSVEEIFFNN
jgi:putative transcriptional regulator